MSNISGDRLYYTSLGITVSLILYFIIGWRHKDSSESAKAYFRAGGNLGAEGLATLLAGNNLAYANAFVYYAYLGARCGLSAIWIGVFFLIGSKIFSRMITQHLREAEVGTLHTFLGHRINQKFRIFAAAASLIGLSLNFAWEIVSCSELLRQPDAGTSATSASSGWVATGCIIVCMSYCYLGGLRSNVAINRLQNVMGTIGLFVLLHYALKLNGFSLSEFLNGSLAQLNPSRLIKEMGFGELLVNCAINLSWQLVDLSAWQDVSATQPGSVKRGINWSLGPTFVLAMLLPTAIGSLAGSNGEAVRFLADASMPILATVVVVVAMFGIAISTSDSCLMAATQTFSWDMKHHSLLSGIRFDLDQLSRDQNRLVVSSGKSVVAIAATLSGGVVLWLRFSQGIDLFNIGYIVYAAQASLIPAVWFGLKAKRTAKGRYEDAPTLAGILALSYAVIHVTFLQNVLGAYNWALPAISVTIASVGFVPLLLRKL